MNTTETITRVVPVLDPEVGEQLGDDILLDVAKTEKVKRVKGSGRASSLQSHTARAWTRGGNVD